MTWVFSVLRCPMPPPTLTLTLALTLTLTLSLTVLGYGYHGKVGPGGETTHLGLFSMLRHPSPHTNPNPNSDVGRSSNSGGGCSIATNGRVPDG
jgi:hypothetical protein